MFSQLKLKAIKFVLKTPFYIDYIKREKCFISGTCKVNCKGGTRNDNTPNI